MQKSNLVWIIDDDRSIRWVLEKALQQAGIDTDCFDTGDRALAQLTHKQPDAIISDIRMPGTDGLSLLANLHREYPQLPFIIMTAHSDLDSAVSAYQGGAFEYLPKPFDVDEAVAVTQRALHRHSPRRDGPFIALNMAAIPRDLIESELFGHEKGAFTGAASLRQGRFQQADGGTLFLDEIGDMPAETQTRLLRVLADGEFYRVGGHTPIKVDVRIIAATHQNLEHLVEENRFREDLFHRLNVIRIHLPKLADRREDIPKLAQHFFHKAAGELNVEPKMLTAEAEAYLSGLSWPGNVRQLENTCRWITVMASGREVHVQDLPPEMVSRKDSQAPSGDWEKALRHWADQCLAAGQHDILSRAVPTFERALIETALKHTAGRKRDAANLLGWGRNTLTRKLKELGMADADTDDGSD